MPRLLVPSLLAILMLCLSAGMNAQPLPQDPIALVNANVVNVGDGSLQRSTTVVVRGGRIESIAAGPAPAGVRTVDVRGRYVVPGLIDAHVHIANLRALRTALESGVTTVRSSGVSSYVDVGMRELVKQGAIPGPDVLASGYHVRPFVAEEAFMDHPSLAPLMRGGMTKADALRQMVQANLTRGVDWIKVLATERAGTPETDPRKQVYTEAELAAIVEEAGKKGVPVQAHAHGAEGALAAVKAGVRSIEHGTYLTDEALKLMAGKGTFFVPTFATVIDVAEPGGDYDNRDLQLRGAHMLLRLEQTIKRAHQMGVKIVTGADTAYGPASVTRISREVTELVRMGVPALTSLQAATLTAAELLGLEKQIGRIAPGFEADLLVVEVNPLESIGTLQDPLLVMSNGRVAIDRLTFGEMRPRSGNLERVASTSTGKMAGLQVRREMSFRLRTLTTALSFVLGINAAPALAQHDHPGGLSSDQVGNVDFETSCNPGVKGDFNRAVALLHSFWFPEAIATFEGVLKADPTCAMAHWGIALSQWGNPFGGQRVAQAIERGRAAAEQARATGSPTPRERGYIEAVAMLFTSADPGTQRDRVLAYAKAMDAVAAANPTDLEAKIFDALAISQTALPTDKTYAQQLKAAAILEPLFKAHPGHPGLAHYIIHAYDYPALAPKALDAARRYASLAPAVPHALHMPSHTFTRVGYWKESIDTNRASADAARKSASSGDELHALDYQVYAYLQLAQDKAARAAIDRALAVVATGEGATAGVAGVGSFAVAAMSARYALERGAWAEAAALPVRPANTPYTEAMTHFARAIGAARSGAPQAAAPEIERLAALRDKLVEMKDPYWPEQLDIQRRVALAWVTFADGRKDEAVRQLATAADAEDATDKSAISPGPLAPARELLGFMLLDAGRPQEALVAFEATMKKEPNRFRGVYGAARAAEAAGNRQNATTYYRQLLDTAKAADTDRAELQQAKQYLAR